MDVGHPQSLWSMPWSVTAWDTVSALDPLGQWQAWRCGSWSQAHQDLPRSLEAVDLPAFPFRNTRAELMNRWVQSFAQKQLRARQGADGHAGHTPQTFWQAEMNGKTHLEMLSPAPLPARRPSRLGPDGALWGITQLKQSPRRAVAGFLRLSQFPLGCSFIK